VNQQQPSVSFIHLRNHETLADPANGDQLTVIPAAWGGCTIGYTIVDVEDDDTLRVLYSIAKCSNVDNFNKSIGRNIVTGRLKKGRTSDVCLLNVPRSLARHEIHNILKNKYYESEETWDHNIRRRVY
jgi:hypothetical protein